MAEQLWSGGPILNQREGVFPLGADALALSDFARPGPRDRILDLGTGSGVLPLILCWDRPEVSATAVEISPAACGLARENISRNGLEDRITLLEGDLRNHRQLLPMGVFDLAVSNPPYFPKGSGKEARLSAARMELTCALEDLCAAAAWSLRYGGRFCLVFRPERLCDLTEALRAQGMEPKRIRPVHHDSTKPVNLLLLEAKKGGRPGLQWEKDLYLFTEAGQFSAIREVR